MPEELELNIDQLPFSMEAEQSVLGAILVEPECIAKVLELLTPESFYRPQHRQLFSIMLAMFTSAQPIDFVTVLEKAKSERVFASDADAKVYLTQLVQVVPSAANVEAYAKLVQEKYYMRTLIGVAKSIISNSEKSDADARGLMEFAEQKLYEIRQGKDATGWSRSTAPSLSCTTSCSASPATTATSMSASPPVFRRWTPSPPA